MKYIYKNQYAYVNNQSTQAVLFSLITTGKDSEPVPVYVGAAFYPNGNDTDEEYIRKHNIELTPIDVYRRNKDKQISFLDDMAGYFPSFNMIKLEGPMMKTTVTQVSFDNNPREQGIVGKWTKDIDKNAKLYYYVMNNEVVVPMFIVQDTEMRLASNYGNVTYIVNINGNMIDCSPEEGDIIYTTREEAEKHIKKHNKKQ